MRYHLNEHPISQDQDLANNSYSLSQLVFSSQQKKRGCSKQVSSAHLHSCWKSIGDNGIFLAYFHSLSAFMLNMIWIFGLKSFDLTTHKDSFVSGRSKVSNHASLHDPPRWDPLETDLLKILNKKEVKVEVVVVLLCVCKKDILTSQQWLMR